VETLAASAAADAELGELLAASPGSVAQQTPGWRDAILGAGEDEPLALACRSEGRLVGLLPAWRFEGPLGAVLTSCAQAGSLGGVACRAGADREAVYRALLGAFVELARERGCAVATLISNPFQPDRELCEAVLAPDFVLENVCQAVDLEAALDAEGEPVGVSAALRRNLRRACSGALRVDEEQSAANLREWYAIHAARHREIGAEPLPEALLRGALEGAVPRGAGRFFFVRRTADGEMVAGGLYLHHGSVLDAFMPSIRSADAALRPAYLLALHTMRFARARGLRFYNWQASPPDGGVERFKRQWGSRDHGYAYLTRVTGDVEPILAASPETVRAAYRWHYVLPFDRMGPGAVRGGRVSARRDAWRAAASRP
jgi:hypothetical protein